MKKNELKGVGGWLLLLILVLIVVGPVWRLIRTLQKWKEVRNSNPDYAATAEFEALHSLAWGTYVATSLLGIAVGILLWRRHRRSTVLLAIAGIWLMSPMAEAISYVFASGMVGEPASLSDFSVLIVPTASALLWTAYLLRSERVRNTFGD